MQATERSRTYTSWLGSFAHPYKSGLWSTHVAKSKDNKQALVGLIMGSKSDWETMKQAADMLELLEIPYEKRVISAHRAPELLREYCRSAQGRGLKVIIAGAGGAAHLAGVTAAQTTLPVL